MKRTGIILIVVGLLFTIFTGFGFFTKEKVVDMGNLEITKSKPHRVNWSPYVGIAVMVAGVVVLLAAPKKSL